MSTPGAPGPAKLVISLLTGDQDLFEPVVGELTARFGRVDRTSPWLAFDFTAYYEPEMGPGLMRRMLSFENLIQQQELPDVKLFTNKVEAGFSSNGKRRINLDPGYLVLERLVLATGKNFTHRVYLQKGIYADLTLIYQKGKFRTLPWTYPDYASLPVLEFLTQARQTFASQLKSLDKKPGSQVKGPVA